MAGAPAAAASSRRPRSTAAAVLGVASLPLVMVAVDLALDKRLSFLGWGADQWKIWCTGLAWDLSAWIAFLSVARSLTSSVLARWKRLGSILVWTDSLALASAVVISGVYRAHYHHLPNVHALEFAMVEWRNTLTIAQDYADLRAPLAISALGVVFWFLHRLALASLSGIPLASRGKLGGALMAWAMALGLSPLALGWHRFQEPLPLLSNWSRIFFQAGLGLAGNKTNLQTPTRVCPTPVQARWNLVLILNESLRQDALVPGGQLLDSLDARDLAPRFQTWSNAAGVVSFPWGRSNSTATSMSVPSLLTGVPPHGSSLAFHRSPSLFTAAKAAGLRTFLVTSQDWRWEHFDQFFFGGIDTVVHRTAFAVPRNNDLGVDDSLVVQPFESLLSLPGRFFGVVQLNSNHGPFWPGPGLDSLPGSSRPRYQASVRYVDRILGRILSSLERDHRWDSTVVVVVSDHGENIGARDLGRINSYHEETVRIPYLVRLPPALASDSSRMRNLREWSAQPVDLLDIFPTAVDLWGLKASEFSAFLAGRSLLGKPDSSRVLGGQNTGDIRSWDIEGLYLVRGHWKVVLSQGRPVGLFDLSNDPTEARSLWDSLPVRQAQSAWIRAALAQPLRARACRKMGASCPELLLDR